MQRQGIRAGAHITSTSKREAYFLELSRDLIASAGMPLMLTGGVTRRQAAESALAAGVRVVGLGTALAFAPDLPALWKGGENTEVVLAPVQWKDRMMAASATMARVRHQFPRLAAGRRPKPGASAAWAVAIGQIKRGKALRRYRSWLATRELTHQTH